MIKARKQIIFVCVILLGLLGLGGCGGSASASVKNPQTNPAYKDAQGTESGEFDREAGQTDKSGVMQDGKKASKLVYESSMELMYAENFSVDYYEGGYALLTTTMDGTRILSVPEGAEIPEDLEEGIIIFKRPAANIYLAASAVMDMFYELEAIDTITLSGQKEDGWYIEAAKEAMAEGDMLYAGKYNKPDYELIISKDCSLAIENMMISHAPEVMEKMEEFGIPVIIEYSSYESHPLGRVEWIKFFGALIGKEEEAEAAFNEQVEILERITAQLNNTARQEHATQQGDAARQTVAFFFITSNGLFQVRQSSDYVPKMIELAGGKYIFGQLGEPDSKRSTTNMQVEEFYSSAKDVDFIIYNSSIDGGVTSIEELLDKCELLADFKAVQEGNVWCTTNDMYQQSMSIGRLIEDIHTMLAGGGEDDMKYLFRLQ